MGWVMVILVVSLAGPCWGQYDYIDIRNPSLRKIPIAVPVFQVTPKGDEVGIKTADLVSVYLNFTGYFKILDRGGFLMDPENPATDGTTINFRNWTTIGAELLITGNILQPGPDLVEMELRLFDPFKGKMLLGKRYKGWAKDTRRMALKFCSEVIFYLTGDWGIFGSQMAFISNSTGHKEIFVCDFDGGNSRQITRHNAITLTPAWSSDSQWLAYTSYAQGKPELYIKNMKDSLGTHFSKEGLNTTPAWVPGQFNLAVTLSFSGDQDIYLLSGKGDVLNKLTSNWGIDTSPAWSPDGKKMAFVSDRAGSPQIYIKDITSGQYERLTYEGRYNTQPDWSPRGDKIAFSAFERGEINIVVIDLNQRAPVRLTYNSGRNESPSWSPDGSLIAFSSTREGKSRIYVMTSYGTDQRRLLEMPGEQFSPAWSPRVIENP
jgi:TolB protein